MPCHAKKRRRNITLVIQNSQIKNNVGKKTHDPSSTHPDSDNVDLDSHEQAIQHH